MDQYETSEVSLGKSEYICFEIFKVRILNFSLNKETMRNIHNRNLVELAHYLISIRRG